MIKLVPSLWFHTDVREVAKTYGKIFKDSRIISTSELKDPYGQPVHVVIMELAGMEILMMSAEGPFTLNESFSMTINCDTQGEIDYYWDALTSDGGAPVQCGWLKDKYGLSWQVVPTGLEEMMNDPDPAKSQRVFQVVQDAIKLDIKALTDAYNGKE